MKLLAPMLLALLCAVPLQAAAQWQWIDKDGRKVFSDRPPPADIPANQILRQPGGRPAAADAAAAPATSDASAPAAQAAAPAASLPRISGSDKALEERKKQAEAEEAAKKKAADEKFAKDRADNCQRARQAKAGLDSGARVFRMNDKGEREYMDDKQRADEVRRLDGIISRDCKS